MKLPTPPYRLSRDAPPLQSEKTPPTLCALRHVSQLHLRDFLRAYAENPNLTRQPAHLDLETLLAHERLNHDILGHEQILARYAQLFDASPVSPFGVNAGAYLGHLFGNGEYVLLGDHCLWEKEESPTVRRPELGFVPFVVDLVAVEKHSVAGKQPEVHHILRQFRYASILLGGCYGDALFPEIIAGRLPVASVLSVGDYDCEILFRTDTTTKTAWKTACSALEARIAAFVGPQKFRFARPARLPCEHFHQRLVYLAAQ